ncbi:uncharacterized protein B0T23DRAFT_327435, partial [Neurospora hispaniola]
YKYSDYIINFLRNISHVYYQLPLLSYNLNIIILRPRKAKDEPCITRNIK